MTEPAEIVSVAALVTATERLLAYHRTLVKKLSPDANVKAHARGCACEVCEVEIALGKRKNEPPRGEE